MKKFFAAIIIAMLMAGIATVSGKSDVLRKDDIAGQELRKNDVESYKITYFKENKVFVRVHPEISGENDLIKYVNQRQATLNYLSKKRGDSMIHATITFNEKYPVETYKSFMQQYRLEELNYRFISYPEGTGVLSSEIPDEMIQQMEEDIGRNYSKFRLVDRVVAVKTQIPAKDLLRVQNDPRVFLVDAGPVEVYRDNPKKEIRVATDYIYPGIVS